MKDLEQNTGENILFADVCGIIDNARRRVAVYVNSEICLTKWYVGKRIKEDVLYNRRAEYGKQVVKNLATRLTERYGSGWGYESLKHCIRSAYPILLDANTLIGFYKRPACYTVLLKRNF